MQKSKWLRLCVCECACEKYSVKKHLDRRRILCQLRLTQRYATHTHRHFDFSFAFIWKRWCC